jgi:hypothetical protein
MQSAAYYSAYFLNLDQREPPGALFCRQIGHDSGGETLVFLRKYYQEAMKGGLYTCGIANPSEAEVTRFKTVSGEFALSEAVVTRHMTLWLGQLRQAQREAATRALNGVLRDVKNGGANDSVLKNVYIKLMCWLSVPGGGVLRQLGKDLPPHVLYEGDILKHEFYFLRVLAGAGCDVLYLNFLTEDSYRKADPGGSQTKLISGEVRESPPVHFTDEAGQKRLAEMQVVKQAIQKVQGIVNTNSWFTEGSLTEAVMLSTKQRQIPLKQICNIFLLCFGIDQYEEYRNRLYNLKMRLIASGRGFHFAELRLPTPTNEEIEVFREAMASRSRKQIEEALTARLSVSGGDTQVLLAKRALLLALEHYPQNNPGRFYNFAIKVACWLKRYADLLFAEYRLEEQPVFYYYGGITQAEVYLLWLLKEIGVDVLYFSPDKKDLKIFEESGLPLGAQVIELAESRHWEAFPDKEVRVRVATTAYKASRELDSLLYSDTGMFRSRQFPRSNALTLKTTYDEIEILWKVEAKFRPNFQTEGSMVNVPNLFVKICGVPDGETEDYWDMLTRLLTEETFLLSSLPFSTESFAQKTSQARAFLHGSRIDPVAIKAASQYPYAHLPMDTQDFLLEKIQELIEADMLTNVNSDDLPQRILAVLLSLEKEILQLILNFDFTKSIPKLVIVDCEEQLFSLEDCIRVLFLNLIGFDIIVCTPTGYRNLESFIKEKYFETYQIGEFVYNLKTPALRGRRRPGVSLLDRLLKRSGKS